MECRAVNPTKPALIDLSLTQIDPATLAELPDDVRQELLRSLAAPKPAGQRATAANTAAIAASAQEQGEPGGAAEEPARLHVADVAAADAPPCPAGPLLRHSRDLDAAQWRKLSALFPSDLLDELLDCSAVEGWSIIEDWLDEVVFDNNDEHLADVHGAAGSQSIGGGELPSSSSSLDVRPEQVDAIQQLLMLWATSFLEDDLEGVLDVLRKQQQLADRRPNIAAACAACAAAVRAAVRKHYGAGLRA